MLRNNVIKLREECREAFKSSSILSSIVKLALFLSDMSGGRILWSELREKSRELDLQVSIDDLVAYLAVLFPGKIRITCNNTDVYEYFISNFKKFKKSSPHSDVSKMFLAAASEVCSHINSAFIEVLSLH
jgi:hypothetical protein